MANNRIEWSGLEELKAALRTLPEALHAEVDAVIDHRAELAAAEIRQRYPRRTGNLRDHVIVKVMSSDRNGVVYKVRSTARHAHLFEVGSQTRKTALGTANPMPAGRVFIPVMEEHRRQMQRELAALLERHGLIARVT